MTRFLAIDFETANPRRDSPCSIGVVRVERGEITDEWSSLIDPEAEFASWNTSIHGIRAEDVEGAPTFLEVAEHLVDLANTVECVVAHNASFDLSVLRQTLERYRAHISGMRFACTQVFARRWFPDWPTYSLGYVINRLDLYDQVGEGAHHEALWDARACAMVARHGLAHTGASSWEDAAKAAGIQLGELKESQYVGCRRGGSRAGRRASRSEEPVYPSERDINPDHPLYGVSVCFTGALSHLTRGAAAQLVADAGGHFEKNVTQNTDLLVVGAQDLERLAGHTQSAKMRKAVAMAERGHHIEVIGEDDFAELVTS